MERKVTVKSAKLLEVHENRNKLQKEINGLIDQIEVLQKELNKLGIKMQKEKEKAVKETMKLNVDLNEFEYISNFDIKEGEIELVVVDEIEVWKDAYRKKKLKQTPE